LRQVGGAGLRGGGGGGGGGGYSGLTRRGRAGKDVGLLGAGYILTCTNVIRDAGGKGGWAARRGFARHLAAVTSE
jgi:hypothetical protein